MPVCSPTTNPLEFREGKGSNSADKKYVHANMLIHNKCIYPDAHPQQSGTGSDRPSVHTKIHCCLYAQPSRLYA